MSKLFEKFYTDLVMIDKKTVSDGLGGFETSFVEGASFKGSVVTKATTEQRQAESQIGQATYTVTVPSNVKLEYNNLFKRVEDGKIFRVTSDSSDVRTPNVATFSFNQVTAEEYVGV